jgi:two-component system response regulator AtoC
MSQEALRRLMAYHWPGNVRQLENVVERALAFSQGRAQVELQDLTPEVQTSPAATESADVWFPDDGLDFERYISGVELSLIKQSLERTQGNKRQAAKLLKLKRTTLIEKLKRLEPREMRKLPELP